MITIVDYGMGNLRSVEKAFARLGEQTLVSSRPEDLIGADHLVLPGVGAFRDAIAHLHEHQLVEPICEYVKTGRPFLGICLGLQLLFEKSFEDGEYDGLGIIPGKVVKFSSDRFEQQESDACGNHADIAVSPSRAEFAQGSLSAMMTAPVLKKRLKVPHMGWNSLTIERRAPIYQAVDEGAYVYFVHSYHVEPTDPGVIATTTDYGGSFVSSIWKDNIVACQFHPEKSQEVGRAILTGFARM